MTRRHRVVVTREDDAWLAAVDGIEGGATFARSFAELDRAVREVIVLAEDLPGDAMGLLDPHYTFPAQEPSTAAQHGSG